MIMINKIHLRAKSFHGCRYFWNSFVINRLQNFKQMKTTLMDSI